MAQLRVLLAMGLAAIAALFAIGPARAAGPDLSTPEAAVAAYVDAVARQDFDAVIATTSVGQASEGFDFVAQVDRLGALTPNMPGPSTSPFLVALNRMQATAQIASQLRFLTYGLMAAGEITEGKMVKMEAADAARFSDAVRADRLAGLRLVKVGIPNPAIMNAERYQANAIRIARNYSADAMTERLALVSFEGLNFALGFTLLRYGDEWRVMSQMSPIAGTTSLGTPEATTPGDFEEAIK